LAPTWLTVVAAVYLAVCFARAGPVQPERRRPWWVMMATEVSHCGAGCVLGDVISEFATSWPANVWLVNRGIKIPM
jgi:hypothetical protein